MIRHAGLELTFAVLLLTIPVVGTAIRTLLMFAIGFTALLSAGSLPATIARSQQQQM